MQEVNSSQKLEMKSTQPWDHIIKTLERIHMVVSYATIFI